MAFSYSDENFTVIGNLCFVHIILDGTKGTYEIPPAILDRMSHTQVVFTYPYLSSREARGSAFGRLTNNSTRGIGYAIITNSKISLSDVGEGYLFFFFPIDSNK